MNPGILLRSCLFALFQIVVTPIFAVIALATFPFAPLTRYRIISWWARIIAAVRMLAAYATA